MIYIIITSFTNICLYIFYFFILLLFVFRKKSLIDEDLFIKEDKTGIQSASDEDQIDSDDTGFGDGDDDHEFETKKGKNQISRNEWRQKLLDKPIKSYKILEPDTQVPDPIAKRYILI